MYTSFTLKHFLILVIIPLSCPFSLPSILRRARVIQTPQSNSKFLKFYMNGIIQYFQSCFFYSSYFETHPASIRAHLFLLLNIPLYVYNSVCLPIYLWMGFCFQFLMITNRADINVHGHIFIWMHAFISLDKQLQGGRLVLQLAYI